jgi:hypothetical protein
MYLGYYFIILDIGYNIYRYLLDIIIFYFLQKLVSGKAARQGRALLNRVKLFCFRPHIIL